MRFRTALAAAAAALALPVVPAGAAGADVFVITATGTTFGGGYSLSGSVISAGTSGVLTTYGCVGDMTLFGTAGFGTLNLYCGPWTFDCTLAHAAALVAVATCPQVSTFPPGPVYAGPVLVTPHNANPTTSASVQTVLARVMT